MAHYKNLRECFDNESVAFALASGFAITADQDGVKERRRQRWARRKNKGR